MTIWNFVLALRILLALYGLYFVLVLIHEVGHLIAGLACGFRPLYVRVSCLKFVFSQGWSWDWRWRAAISGFTAVTARNVTVTHLAVRFGLFILAGPLANIGCGLLALLFYRDHTVSGWLISFFAIASGLMAVVNLIPQSTAESDSDGKKLFGLLFSKTRRTELRFGLTLIPRFEQVRSLCAAGQVQQAHDTLEELARSVETFSKMSKNARLIRLLNDFRDPLVKALAEIKSGGQDNPGLPSTDTIQSPVS